MKYISLHNHSHYSNLRFPDCIIKPKSLIYKAIELGYGGVALTDHACLSGSMDWLQLRDEIKTQHPDFKVIFGNEIYLIDEANLHNTKDYYHFILLAKDAIGWKQLNLLSDRSWKRSYMDRGQRRVPTTYQDLEEIVKTNPGHLLCSSACLGSQLDKLILAHDVEGANAFVKWLIDVFGAQNIALELQPSDSEEQTIVNPVLVGLAKHYNLKYIVTTDSHYLNREDFEIHSAFVNSKDNTDRETEKFYKFTYVMSVDEIKANLRYSHISEEDIEAAINNTDLFTQDIEEFDFRQATIIPAPELPKFQLQHILKPWYDKYEQIKYYACESKYDQDQYLIYLIEQGILNKHIVIDEEKAERINTELDVLRYISDANDQPMSGYLNLVRKIEDLIWENSVIGISRGSAMSFYINFLVDIVQANPLEYDVKYWRFLNKARSGAGNYPDVDIDIAGSKTEIIMDSFREYFGQDNVINCITFKNETLKAAVQTACRGLNINNDLAQEYSAMVPIYRGKVYSLNDCLEGNDELGFEPQPQFIQKLKEYPRLFETVQNIEGLVNGMGIHASCVYITKKPYYEYVSGMRAPNGTLITCLNMASSDLSGILKFDLLRTDAEEKIMKCLDLLLQQKQIEWKGSLKVTYMHYLHPTQMVYNDPQMWKNMNACKVTDLFQFLGAGSVGEHCLKVTKPENIKQMGAANAVMRLQAVEGQEPPIDRFVRFRNDINEWYKEMDEWGLQKHEVEILEKYLKYKFGCAVEQEDVMLLLMDPEISNFTLKQADAARKTIAKKKLKLIPQLQQDFYTQNPNTSKAFLDYVWKKAVEPQLGYSFSIPHDIGYSLIAWQEVTLFSKFNPLFWTCSCLCVNAGSTGSSNIEDANDDYGDEDDYEETFDNPEEKKKKAIAADYKKIGKAIGNIQVQGVKIAPPDINRASIDFIPDVENNAIIYGLLGVKDVNEDLINQIIANRPYTSSLDFYQRVQPTNVQMISLIKAGAFDAIDKKHRFAIMDQYLRTKAQESIKLKESMTAANIKKAVELKALPVEMHDLVRLYNFNKWIEDHQYSKERKRYEFDDVDVLRYFNQELKYWFSPQDYYEIDGKIMVVKKAMTAVYKTKSKPLFDWLSSAEGCRAFYDAELNNAIQEQKDKYCQGTLATWEFDALTCYMSDHELLHINNGKYGIVDFNTLPEQLKPIGTKVNQRNGQEYNVYDVVRVAGTVVGTDNNKHILTISTAYGIVDVKFYKEEYIYYNKNVSEMVEGKNGKQTKHTIEKSWFTRGNTLLISGVRRENMFIPKKNWDKGYTHTVELITGIGQELALKSKRETTNKNG